MREVFKGMIRDGAKSVRNLLGRCEGVDFDCKLKCDPKRGSLDRDDKLNLGKTLSAFSNSMGGLLLWGVDARRNSAGVDEIRDFVPIAQLSRFENDIKTMCVEALMPRHAGIEVAAIPDDAHAVGSGFVAIWVERSERRPHRNELVDKQYFRRAGDSSRVMEHFEIEDAFKRLTNPIISLEIQKYKGLNHSAVGQLTIEFGLRIKIKNEGAISATFPYVMIPSGFNLDRGQPVSEILQRSEENIQIFEGTERNIIHPGVTRTIACVSYPVSAQLVNQAILIPRDRVMPRTLSLRFGCYNSRIETATCEITTEEICSMFGPSISLV